MHNYNFHYIVAFCHLPHTISIIIITASVELSLYAYHVYCGNIYQLFLIPGAWHFFVCNDYTTEGVDYNQISVFIVFTATA